MSFPRGRRLGWRGPRVGAWAALGALVAAVAPAQPVLTIDLLTQPTAGMVRVYGSEGLGSYGVPVAGGHDVDGDGLEDVAFSAMVASPAGRSQAGAVYLVLGDGTVSGELDTASSSLRILHILGDQAGEHLGSEIWIDDVTGDDIGDLLLSRQDYSAPGRVRCGALTIVVGGAALATLAQTSGELDLRSPPASVDVVTLVGAQPGGRLGIWVRTGDVDGDTVADLAVGADQESVASLTHAGAVYVVRGGAHLSSTAEIDLADFGSSPFALDSLMFKVVPPATAHGHFGATVQLADLDGNGRAEVLASKALTRAGASLGGGHGTGGTTDGTLYIAWDASWPQPWPTSRVVTVGGVPSLSTLIDGGAQNLKFGEELVGGGDYDGDGSADLFVGDIIGSSPNGSASGLGHVFFEARDLKGLSFDLDAAPGGLVITTLYGPSAGAIGADTAAEGDFDNDGLTDLALSSPHGDPLGRTSAGVIHLLYGRLGGWPAIIDLAPGALPPPSQIDIVEVYGGHGDLPGDNGDTLCYSAATGDLDGDSRSDLITNEMLGNGVPPGAVDVGNLIVLGGRLISTSIFSDGFESGDTSRWSATVP